MVPVVPMSLCVGTPKHVHAASQLIAGIIVSAEGEEGDVEVHIVDPVFMTSVFLLQRAESSSRWASCFSVIESKDNRSIPVSSTIRYSAFFPHPRR